MSLSPGSRFGSFEVQSKLGAGGMGEVFRARDTRLGRDVALKVLPAAFATDQDRLERLSREARALAALNHPSIAAIYDTVDVDGIRALVLEFVEGVTLEERLRGGAIPVRDAISLAKALAEALDAAHDRGMVHRDLKPANIKITADGAVKLLDFGIARMLFDSHGGDITTVAGTGHGVILGTAAYMSPEQARGQAVDKRADVWAFGCVLFEMLTGRAPFRGETWSDSIAQTLTNDPDWNALPTQTPPGVIGLLRRCLRKDPKERLRGLAGLELVFEQSESPAPASPRPAGRSYWRSWLPSRSRQQPPRGSSGGLRRRLPRRRRFDSRYRLRRRSQNRAPSHFRRTARASCSLAPAPTVASACGSDPSSRSRSGRLAEPRARSPPTPHCSGRRTASRLASIPTARCGASTVVAGPQRSSVACLA